MNAGRRLLDWHTCLVLVASLAIPDAAASGWLRTLIGGGRPILTISSSSEQVTAIGHCHDTYAVTTADGKTRKFWEFDLRFKTDSSRHGPPSGAPVLLETGMQGDRAFVIFAAPQEISAFIRESCTGA